MAGRRGAVEARRAHNPKVASSNLAAATIKHHAGACGLPFSFRGGREGRPVAIPAFWRDLLRRGWGAARHDGPLGALGQAPAGVFSQLLLEALQAEAVLERRQ